ncbi:MAG: hypothetical protein WC951_13915 [Bacteroidales bacterium]|nr:hypothetical protein [Tenuifilaceae bacterium]
MQKSAYPRAESHSQEQLVQSSGQSKLKSPSVLREIELEAVTAPKPWTKGKILKPKRISKCKHTRAYHNEDVLIMGN